MKKSKSTKTIVTFFIISILLSFILPCFFLYNYSIHSIIGKIRPLGNRIYNITDSAIAFDASRRLTESDKIKLITGEWNSTAKEVFSIPSKISESEIIDTVRLKIRKMYRNNQVDFNFDSHTDNWYSWKIKYYRYTDSGFNIYSAYCYDVTFTKYDSSEIHNIRMTEGGTILSYY